MAMVAPSQRPARAYAYAMTHGNRQRSNQCHACGQAAAGDGDRCIFCGGSLVRQFVSSWRSVYHPYSYADALLANATLQAHGLNARLKHERPLMGHVGSVVEVAEGEHLFAQEVLRQLRGVRTDTEYREWHELKQQRMKRKLMLCAMAAATATAAVIALGLEGLRRTEQPAAEAAGERGQTRNR
jgi:hypothetical protein